jgi:hypothetical protein
MPKAGDRYIVTLKKAHLQWGTHRYTSTRGNVYGEGYLQIPRAVALRLNIYNSNHPNANFVYNCNSLDGLLNNVEIKASGSMVAGDPLAKQFQGNGNLQIFGGWYSQINAQIGDKILVVWTSPTNITVQKI